MDLCFQIISRKMSLVRFPTYCARRCLIAAQQRSSFVSVNRSFSSESDSPSPQPVEAATIGENEILIRGAIAAVKSKGVAAEAALEADTPLPPIDSYPENYETQGMEYTGRAHIRYDDAFIHYKLEVDMEKLRLEQPHPKVPDVDRFKN